MDVIIYTNSIHDKEMWGSYLIRVLGFFLVCVGTFKKTVIVLTINLRSSTPSNLCEATGGFCFNFQAIRRVERKSAYGASVAN